MTPKITDLLEIIVQHDVLLRQIPGRLDGDIDYEKMRIRIDPRQTMVKRVDTLIHEALHAYHVDLGSDTCEQTILRETTQIMRQLYGDNYAR